MPSIKTPQYSSEWTWSDAPIIATQKASNSSNIGASVCSNVAISNFVAVFDGLYILGLVFLATILLTAWRSGNIRRASTWFMFIIAWFFTSASNLIILGQQTGPCPGGAVCLLQAALIYGMPALSSLYAVAFMIQLHLSIRNAITYRSLDLSRKTMIMIHALPCGTFIAIIIEVLTIGVLYPETIQRDHTGMYCNLNSGLPSKVTAGITILAMVTFLILGGKVFLTIRRKWKVTASSSSVNIAPPVTPDVATRVLIFSFCPILALAASFFEYLPHYNITIATQSRVNIVLASLPLVAGVIFGSQRDLIGVWLNFKWWKFRNHIEPVTLQSSNGSKINS